MTDTSAIGLQLWTMPYLLEQDFEGTIETIAKIGYKEVEFFGPYFFSPPSAIKSFEQMGGVLGLSDHGYYGRSPSEIRNLLDSAGLTAPSAHVGFDTLTKRLDQAVEAAHEVGHRYLTCGFIEAQNRTSLDAYRRMAEAFNQIGARCKEQGLQFAYHNHCFEFGQMQGRLPYEVLLEATDPELVQMELDLFWTRIAGQDPVDYLRKYPDRFSICHVKDMVQETVVEDPLNVFEDPEAMEAAMQQTTDVGDGVINFKRILSHADRVGVEHYVVERDLSPDPHTSMKLNFNRLLELQTLA